MKQIIDGIEVDLTPEESAEYNARQALWDAQAPERLITQCQTALELHIDAVASEKSYSSGVSCASYKDSTNAVWAAEAIAFIEWRDVVYTYAYDYLARAQLGDIESPTVDDFMSGVTAIIWPEVSPE